MVITGCWQCDTVTTPITTLSLASERLTTSTSSHVRGARHTCAHHPLPFSFLTLDAEHTWHEGARFASPAELAMCLCWGLALVCVSLGKVPFDGTLLAMRTSNGVRPGLVSKFLCILPIMLISTFHSWTIRRPTLKHSLHPYCNLSLWSSSILSMSSHVSQPTYHYQDTPLQHSPCFSDPPFLALGLAALPFHHTYLEYFRATNTMGDVLLIFVRWQDAPSKGSSRRRMGYF